MFAVMTFVGIGVDYGIHMVHRFQHATRDTAGEVIAHLGPVIMVAGAHHAARLRHARHLVVSAAAIARPDLDRDGRSR